MQGVSTILCFPTNSKYMIQIANSTSSEFYDFVISKNPIEIIETDICSLGGL